MYGTAGSDGYETTHANANDSTIKAYLDNWYKTNIEDKGLSSYISDTLFCNDRSLLHNTAQDYAGQEFSNLGYGTERTAYRWYGDPMAASMGDEYANLLTYPNLQCPNQNDRFTVDDEVTGNGDLTYPIGLINTDEIYLAGGSEGYGISNSGYYLYTGNTYWTMSPYNFNGSGAIVRFVNSNGNAEGNNYVYNSYGVRPVINLKVDSLKLGDGTASNPYSVESV